MAGRALAQLQEEFSELEIKRVDVIMHPQKAWQEGIRMIPCLRAGNKKISGIMLSKEKIRSFLNGL